VEELGYRTRDKFNERGQLEGFETMGPTLRFKGIENFNYYRLVPDNLRYYMDYTGTGNTLNVRQARSLQLIMDSLRYWVTEMHVDGFRFDLAATLSRELHAVSRRYCTPSSCANPSK
jgi:pullulanase/glycogen debranching enzyme